MKNKHETSILKHNTWHKRNNLPCIITSNECQIPFPHTENTYYPQCESLNAKVGRNINSLNLLKVMVEETQYNVHTVQNIVAFCTPSDVGSVQVDG